jgi:hypothetical protein
VAKSGDVEGIYVCRLIELVFIERLSLSGQLLQSWALVDGFQVIHDCCVAYFAYCITHDLDR